MVKTTATSESRFQKAYAHNTVHVTLLLRQLLKFNLFVAYSTFLESMYPNQDM